VHVPLDNDQPLASTLPGNYLHHDYNQTLIHHLIHHHQHFLWKQLEEYHLGECGENQDRKLYMWISSCISQVMVFKTDEMGNE
jgi:hypothetical protein